MYSRTADCDNNVELTASNVEQYNWHTIKLQNILFLCNYNILIIYRNTCIVKGFVTNTLVGRNLTNLLQARWYFLQET